MDLINTHTHIPKGENLHIITTKNNAIYSEYTEAIKENKPSHHVIIGSITYDIFPPEIGGSPLLLLIYVNIIVKNNTRTSYYY